jgi:hypothetical protein
VLGEESVVALAWDAVLPLVRCFPCIPVCFLATCICHASCAALFVLCACQQPLLRLLLCSAAVDNTVADVEDPEEEAQLLQLMEVAVSIVPLCRDWSQIVWATVAFESELFSKPGRPDMVSD